MSQGICLSIGLNAVDAAKYDGWEGRLNACEADARDIAAIATSNGFTSKILLTREASATAVVKELYLAAERLVSGDTLVLNYSGHGAQVGDVDADETDSLDETWCLYDRMLIDDELYAMWAKFKAGVRILVLSDSCNSGTVTKVALYKALAFSAEAAFREFGPKVMPFEKSWDIYQNKKELYDSIQYLAGAESKAAIKASVTLISGCQDNQLSLDGALNSLFTAKLKKVWNNGSFQGGLRLFHKKIVAEMPPSQTPNFFTVGPLNMEFEAQRPFTI